MSYNKTKRRIYANMSYILTNIKIMGTDERIL